MARSHREALADGLELVLKSGSSELGNVAPNSAMNVAEFQNKIAATRIDWVVDET